MFNIDINNNVLYGIIAVVVLFFIIATLCFISFMYHTKRKYDSINMYNTLVSDKLYTYNKNIEQYDKNIEDCGIKTNRENRKILSKIITFIKSIRDSK